MHTQGTDVKDKRVAQGDATRAALIQAARDLFEKSYVVKGLARHEHNVTHTARELGISRQHLQNLIKKHGITKFTDSGEFEVRSLK